MKDEEMLMIRMQQGMTVSKAGTEALAAVVAVNKCIYTDRDWLEAGGCGGEEQRAQNGRSSRSW
jgi:hypothetical protein